MGAYDQLTTSMSEFIFISHYDLVLHVLSKFTLHDIVNACVSMTLIWENLDTQFHHMYKT